MFTISGPTRESAISGKSSSLNSNATNSRSPVSTLNRDSGFSENKYKWTEGVDDVDKARDPESKPPAQTSGRRVCCVVAVVILLCAVVAAVIAVVIVFVVNKPKGRSTLA